jgi:EAL domain-containing protein (putative c-di-GMP-specific phosphodiesterase class I)
MLARRIEATPIAEGVEDAADLEVVTGFGIPLVQGYLFAHAVPACDLPSEAACSPVSGCDSGLAA